MIVTGSECGSIAQAVESDSIVRSAEADSTGVAGELSVGDVVSGLGTEEESVTTEDGVGGECWSLEQEALEHLRRTHVRGTQSAEP